MKRLLLVLILFSVINYAQEPVKYHKFSGAFSFTVEGGLTLGFTDYENLKPEVLGRGSLEYFFPTTSAGIFGIRAFYAAGFIGGKNYVSNDGVVYPELFRTSTQNIGGGFSYTFPIADAVFPFIFLGSSYQWFNPRDAASVDLPYGVRTFDGTTVNYHIEAGLKFLLSRHISLNFSVGSQFSSEDNWDAAPPEGANDYALYGLTGLSFYIGGRVDTDGDGVSDSDDMCPNTPPGVKVDEFGCPLDSDGDGVPDYLDKCANTPSGVKVDANGCPLDTDGDGVPDYLDKCSNTPSTVKVDASGCPLDTDGDGVPDYLDKCTNTPAKVQVDANGCPLDEDGDGVPDYLDKCPNTPKGDQVDSDGCSTKTDTVTVTVREVITLAGDTNFEFNKSSLLPAAYQVLDPLAETMKKNPNTRWKIEGHTDAVGSDSYNMELSRKRAQSVVDYIAGKGIERSRLEVVPLGESQPAATNDTQEGRSMNRRVEIKLIK